MSNRAELAAFLRTRRGRLRPSDVGLPELGARRTPGLRRQEVAQLAGISVDYYIRVEQARGSKPSRQVLSALARALMLSMMSGTTCSVLAARPRLRSSDPIAG
ncbi:helix-turn-helix domain-containing protein [Nocardia asiatica]|uniref:helix-turn-helix domain-containing protein n=1 Tax=Nocardia asiatica TaxID=209252 RepID=UPI003EDFBEF6